MSTHRPAHPTTAVDHRASVAAETAAFVAAVQGADPTTPVPSCPGWNLADLVKHTGSVQRWFAVLLRKEIQQPPTSRDVDLQLPPRPEDYPDWLAASAVEAAGAFAATAPDTPMWAWGPTSTPGSGPAGCCTRRWCTGWTPSSPSDGGRWSTARWRWTVWTSS